jgi:hypothetical protein
MSNKEQIESFSKKIHALVSTDRINYIDAIVEICESHGIEVESAAKLIIPQILSEITREASSFNLLKEKINSIF